jgi:hypothetical protein
MEGFRYVTPSLAALFLTLAVTAQSRASAKFDRNDEIIGLFNLVSSEIACRDMQAVTGTIRNVRTEFRDSNIVFSFMIVSGDRQRSLLTNKNRFRVPV